MEPESNHIVSIIIVTRGVNGYLKSCLDSIEEQTYPPAEVIVIDNSLDENFSRNIIEFYPEVKLYAQTANTFYCEALNLGIKQAKGDFLLCLNDDCILDKSFIQEALRGFFIDSKVGMVSGKILRSDRITLDSSGLFLNIWLGARERGYGVKDKAQFEKEEYIFGVNGAVAFYRKAMLEEVKENGNYFDPDFHIFYEDLDIAWRAHRYGWKGYYVPSAIAYHLRGGSVREKSGIGRPFARHYLNAQLQVDLIKNRYLAIIKNESACGFLLHFPAIVIYDFVVWAYVLLFRPAILRILIFNSGCLNKALRKRILRR